MRKPIKDFPNYEIDENGIVYSKFKGAQYRHIKASTAKVTWKPLKHVLDKGVGYYLVSLIRYEDDGSSVKRNKFIHRLLCEAFLPNPDGKKHVNHKDGDKTNNDLSNLEWATEKENSQHAVDNGLTTYEHCEAPVVQMDDDFSVIAEFKSITEAMKATGVQGANISKVVRKLRPKAGGFRWKYK